MASSSVPANTGEPDLNRENLPASIRLPRTSSRLAAPRAFCQLVTGIRRRQGHFWFDGPFSRPGAQVDAPLSTPLLIECAGSISKGHGHRRPEILWILWKWQVDDWQECGRALAIGAEWALLLGPLAEDLLREPIGLYDVKTRARDLADQAIAALDQTFQRETSEVRRAAWLSVYDQIPGRIVE